MRKHQNKKQFRLNKRIGDAHKAGDRHTKLSQHFQASRRGVRNIIKKLKEYRRSLAEGAKDFKDWKEN